VDKKFAANILTGRNLRLYNTSGRMIDLQLKKTRTMIIKLKYINKKYCGLLLKIR
jgi:hypothetical protein